MINCRRRIDYVVAVLISGLFKIEVKVRERVLQGRHRQLMNTGVTCVFTAAV